MKKYDERNTLFSRVKLDKMSKEYRDYYTNNPSTKHTDDNHRRISFRNNLRKDQRFKNLFFPITKFNAKYIKSVFDIAESHPVNNNRLSLDGSFSKNIKEITKYYGATDVGIVKLKDIHYYSHSGGVSSNLGIESYGDEIKPKYNTAIVYTVVMDKKMINRAPHFEELLATEEAYLKVANIGSRLTMYLKEIGYKTVFNNSDFYLSPLVPLAVEAGLGQIGMCNHLVTKKYGNNVRLGAVFTTLEIDYDHPIDFDLYEFCKQCALCLTNCPSRAITHKERIVHGKKWYKFDDNKCYEMWVKSGTDCGTCIQACPFTQGVNQRKLSKIKDEPYLIKEIMDDHYRIHGRREYQKDELDIVKEEKNDKNN